MADFVRGNPDGLYSPDVVAGITMHRQVDKFTDQHPIVINAKQLFGHHTVESPQLLSI